MSVSVVLLVVVAAAAGGWVAASRIQSPAEAAARTAAPEPSPILVPAELRELSTDVVTRGTGRFGSPQTIFLSPSAFKTQAPIVTSLPEQGAEISEGEILAVVSGRPVFLLIGPAPMYRDLGSGMSGNDVLQLEESLERLGSPVGAVDGVFDSDTATAVKRLYEGAGYEPVVATEAQLAEFRPSEALLLPGGFATQGIQIPADEIAFVPSSPVRVSEFNFSLGEVIEGPLAMVTNATVAIDTSVPVENAGLIAEGMTVLLDEPDLGIESTGVISRVASGPGTDGVDGFHVYFEVLVDEAAPALVNASVRVTVPIESSGAPVLAVPVAALSLGADGSSRVQRMVDGAMEFITVEPGLSADGFVAITVVEGSLEPGALVVIGFDSPAS